MNSFTTRQIWTLMTPLHSWKKGKEAPLEHRIIRGRIAICASWNTPSQDSSGGGYFTVRLYEAGELLSAVAYDYRGGVSAEQLVEMVEDVGKMFNECDNANDHYPIGSVSIMYHSERRRGGNLCQYKVSGKEFCYKPGIKRM